MTEFGVLWTCADGRTFTACGYTEAGAVKTAAAVNGRDGWSMQAQIVCRDVSDWRPVGASSVGGEDQK